MSNTWTYTQDPDVEAHTGFLLAEEAALKKYLSGHKAPEPRGKAAVDIPVYFRWPESERKISYPYMTIDLVAIRPDYALWQSLFDLNQLEWYYNPSTAPTITPAAGTNPYDTNQQFLPYQLVFQVSTFARSALHDRFLTSRMITSIFPPRPFWIGVDADLTWRRAELVDLAIADTAETTEASKRIFRKIYTIQMAAEVPTEHITAVMDERVSHVHIDLYDKDMYNMEDREALEAVDHPVDAEHTKGEPIDVTPPPIVVDLPVAGIGVNPNL